MKYIFELEVQTNKAIKQNEMCIEILSDGNLLVYAYDVDINIVSATLTEQCIVSSSKVSPRPKVMYNMPILNIPAELRGKEYQVVKYRGRWSLYSGKSNTYMVYEGSNKLSKRALEHKAMSLNHIMVDEYKKGRGEK